MPHLSRTVSVGVCCSLFLFLFYHSLNKPPSRFFLKEELYKSWKKCVLSKFEPLRGDHARLWAEFQPLVSQCDKPYADILLAKEYANSDEAKHHIHPLVSTSNNTIVTLGIGHDIRAEEKLLEAMGKDNVQFYGADPMTEVNSALYTRIGNYYPVAVGGKAGYSEASVLQNQTYQQSSVVYVDAVYFLTKMVGLKFFDNIFLDAEHGEYEMFPMFLKGGGFDQNGVTICQINMEMHTPDDAKKKLIHDFIFQILEEERYAFFFPVSVSHLRIFFVNFHDKECVNKYIPKILSIQSSMH